jgi:hypothetical protein
VNWKYTHSNHIYQLLHVSDWVDSLIAPSGLHHVSDWVDSLIAPSGLL